jgi:hypothetical protein
MVAASTGCEPVSRVTPLRPRFGPWSSGPDRPASHGHRSNSASLSDGFHPAKRVSRAVIQHERHSVAMPLAVDCQVCQSAWNTALL